MICQNKETKIKYNFKEQADKKIKLWNNLTKRKFVSLDEFNENYNIIDKFLSL